MANRYWVGNGGSWTDNTHWSYTSGGPGGLSPFIDGVLWTGAIRTVGIDKEFTNPFSAFIDANTAGEDCLFLIDSGIYNVGGVIRSSRKFYIRGLGNSSTNTVINMTGQFDLLGSNTDFMMENITFYGSEVGHTGTMLEFSSTGDIIFNKCILGTESNSRDQIISGTGNSLSINYSKIVGCTYGAYWWTRQHINSSPDRGKVSFNKVSWTPMAGFAGWTDHNSNGTYALDDKVQHPASGYGPEYGSYIITFPSVPVSGDNIIFDSNSITLPNQTITMAPGSPYLTEVPTLDFSNILNSPTLDTTGTELDIHGDLILKEGMTVVSGEGNWINFFGDCNLTSNGVSLRSNDIMVDEIENSLTITDDTILRGLYSWDDGSVSLNDITLTLNGYSYTLDIEGSFDAGTSTIIFDMSNGDQITIYTPDQQVLYNLIFQNAIDIEQTVYIYTGGNLTVNNITFLDAPYSIDIDLNGGKLFANDFIADGLNRDNLFNFYYGLDLDISSGIIDVSYCRLEYSNATGGATFNSYLINGNVDGGNNTGWNWGPTNIRYRVPKSRILCLNFEGINGATTWEEEVQGLTPSNGTGLILDTSIKKFGTSSLLGTAQPGTYKNTYYYDNNNTTTFGDMTVHGWFRLSGLSLFTTLNYGITLVQFGSNLNFTIFAKSGGGTELQRVLVDWVGGKLVWDKIANPFVNDQWYHLAVIAHGRNVMYSINGTIQETWIANVDNPIISYNLGFGVGYNVNSGVSCRWDAWELVNYAKWIENFTPPTEPPPYTIPIGTGYASGNWDDNTAWSISSGGYGGQPFPTKIDDVIFDENSFPSSGQTLTFYDDSYECKSIDFTNVTNFPTIKFNPWTGNNNVFLNVYGDITFSPNMYIDFPMNLSFDNIIDELFNCGIVIRRLCHLTSAGLILPPIKVEYVQ